MMKPSAMNGDPWVWRAEFADGTALDEYDATDAPEGRGWADVQAHGGTLARVVLVPQRPGLATHVGLPAQGARVRVFRRRTVAVSPVTGEEVARPDPITVLALDWPGADGRTAYTFLFADGSVLVSDELNAV